MDTQAGSDIDVLEMCTRYANGDPLKVLAADYGVSTWTVRKRLVAARVTIRPTGGVRNQHLDEHKEQIAARYVAGESMPKLGVAYGVDYATIWRRLADWGVLRRDRGRKPGGPLFGWGVNGEYLATSDRNGHSCRIHRACWEAYHREMPSGHIIHHIDGNKRNNSIRNLSCMTLRDHSSLHSKERRERKQCKRTG